MPIPAGVRAAFDLECFNNRMVCVVSGEVFDSLEGYATIFHEFIHCRQGESCEPHLKKRLRIAIEAYDRGDCMWELNYPFPYDNSDFVPLYRLFMKALQMNDSRTIRQCRRELSEQLSEDDYEYMVWQEWKEGFARYIENLVRLKLGLSAIPGREDEQLDRRVFYEGGAAFIEFLVERKPFLAVEIDELFDMMYEATVKFTFSDVETAFYFAGSESYGMHTAVLCRDTGKVLFRSDMGGIDEIDKEKDLDWDQCINVPHRNELGLGRDLVLEFMEIQLPHDLHEVERIFHSKGAYSRFKALLESHGALQKWYDFESTRQQQVIRDWCVENRIELKEHVTGDAQKSPK